MSKIVELIKKNREIILYVIVGALTTAVSFSVQWIFKDVITVSAGLATFIAWFASVLFAFFANKIVVFESKTTEKKGFFIELGLFYASRVFTGGLEVLSMYILVDKLFLNYWLIKVIATIVVLVLNYILSKIIVFKKKKDENKK